ncbi:MAG TPA: MFS transporter [Candidatus Cybelea sp.]|nr:MFS transporter [Candidatus Cybelea sp.]
MQRNRRQHSWAAIAASTFVNLPFGSLYAYSVFLRPMEQLFGAARSELSAMFALATISFTLGMNLAPRLFRLAPAPVLVAFCAISSALGLALAASATSLPLLMVGYGVLFGLGGGIAYIVVQQGVNMMVRSRKGLVNGYVVGLYPAGAMIAAPLFGWAIGMWGLRFTLAGLGATLAVCGMISVWLVVHAGVRLHAETAEAPEPGSPGRVTIFWQIWIVFFLAAAAGLTVLSQAAGIIVAYGGSTALALFATTAITGAIAAARLGGGWLVDRLSVPIVMAGAHGLALAGTVVLTAWPDPLVSAVTLAMIGMGYGFVSGSTAAAVACYWPSQSYGRIASRIYIAWCLAAVTLPVLAGHLFDVTGGYGAIVVIAGCGNVLGIAIALTLPRQSKLAVAAA